MILILRSGINDSLILLSEEDTGAKDKDIDQNQDCTYTEQDPVRFFRKMEQEQILFRRKGLHGACE